MNDSIKGAFYPAIAETTLLAVFFAIITGLRFLYRGAAPGTLEDYAICLTYQKRGTEYKCQRGNDSYNQYSYIHGTLLSKMVYKAAGRGTRCLSGNDYSTRVSYSKRLADH
jgi:hypothetical protein